MSIGRFKGSEALKSGPAPSRVDRFSTTLSPRSLLIRGFEKRQPSSVVRCMTPMLSRTQPFLLRDDGRTPARAPRLSGAIRGSGLVSLSEVLSALSCALDLTEGAPAGHS